MKFKIIQSKHEHEKNKNHFFENFDNRFDVQRYKCLFFLIEKTNYVFILFRYNSIQKNIVCINIK